MHYHPTQHSYVDAHDFLLNHVDYTNIVDWPDIFCCWCAQHFSLKPCRLWQHTSFCWCTCQLIINFFSNAQCLFLLMHMPINIYQMHDSSFKCWNSSFKQVLIILIQTLKNKHEKTKKPKLVVFKKPRHLCLVGIHINF
jgi:hypothetical protein